MRAEGLVLVIDDDRMSRRKLALALNTLGHRAIEADSGEAGLQMMRDEPVDLVLLDIMMPGMDGFEVLQRRNAIPALAEIPVLVISGLDGDMASVVRAIELGATDFLPKQFDATLFRARVSATVEKRRLRLAELDHLRQVDTLISAAETMESTTFHPRKLGLDAVAARTDAVGKLGRVFREMAEQVYARERQLQRNLRTTKGLALLIATGVTSGLGVPLSILLYDEAPMPMGVAMWVNLIAGLICITALVSSRSRKGWLTGPVMGFLAAWAALHGLATVVMFEVAGHVSGIMLSIVVALEGFMVFLLAAILRIESPSLRRFVGLSVGLAGVLTLILAHDRVEGVNDWVWIVIGIVVPVLYAFMDILLDRKQPGGFNPVAMVGVVMLLSSVMTVPLALIEGQLFSPFSLSNQGLMLLVAEGMRQAAVYVIYVALISVAGAVFGSQNAYVATVAGIFWSILLLSETLTLTTLVALALVLIGLFLVGPKREAEDAEVRFKSRKRAA